MSELQRQAGFQGYHQVRNAREDAELTHVGPDTPCGEYLRRYWQPVAMSKELGALPRVVRILGEDLVLFRDGSGRPAERRRWAIVQQGATPGREGRGIRGGVEGVPSRFRRKDRGDQPDAPGHACAHRSRRLPAGSGFVTRCNS